MRRHKRSLKIDERTAFAYVRCGLPPEWEEFYLSLDLVYPSRSTKNRWFQEQWNCIRRFARRDGLKVPRRFFEPEGGPTKLNDPLPLPRRTKLAALYLAVKRLGVRTVLVDHRRRLDDDEVIQGLLVDAFREIGVRIVEASTGLDLSKVLQIEDMATVRGLAQFKVARRVVGRWKGLATRLHRQSRTGRMPFGSREDEAASLARICELYRVLPKDRWRRRGRVVLKRRSFREIAEHLNAEGVRSRTGRPWTARTVQGILRRLGLAC